MNLKSSEFDPSWYFILGFYLKKYSKKKRNIYIYFFFLNLVIYFIVI